jgi:hypothetical protein
MKEKGRARKERKKGKWRKAGDRVRVSTHIRPPPSNVRPRTSKTRTCGVYSASGVGVGVRQCLECVVVEVDENKNEGGGVEQICSVMGERV